MRRTLHLSVALLLGSMLLHAMGPEERSADERTKDLTARFPRTRDLLEHLETADPALRDQLLALPAVQDDREEERALAFAKEHHPELGQLLSVLAEKQPSAYRDALAELVTEVTRLRRLERREETRYASELAAWKVGSEIRLLAARMRRSSNPERLAARLRDALERRESLRRAQWESQVERNQANLARLQARLAESPEASVEREFEALGRRIERRRGER